MALNRSQRESASGCPRSHIFAFKPEYLSHMLAPTFDLEASMKLTKNTRGFQITVLFCLHTIAPPLTIGPLKFAICAPKYPVKLRCFRRRSHGPPIERRLLVAVGPFTSDQRRRKSSNIFIIGVLPNYCWTLHHGCSSCRSASSGIGHTALFVHK